MDLWLENLRVGWEALASNRLRTILTALTVALGSGAIALLVSLASSALATITTGIDAVGGREIVFLEPKKPKQPTAQTASRLTLEDARALRERVPGLAELSYLMSLRNQVMVGAGKKADVDVAIGAAWQNLLLQDLICGASLPEEGAESGRRVVVVSKAVAEELFVTPEAALSQGVLLWGHRYEIVGVTSEAAKFGFNMGGVSKQRAVIVPASTTLSGEGLEPKGFIVMRSNGAASHDLQMRIATSVLSWRHRGVEDFEFFDLEAFMSKFDKVFAGLRVLVGLIAAVSLFIAGAGIMNVMLASVRQRVTEIGIRRALGASQGDIRLQFAIESALIAGVGGVVGALGGTVLSVLVGWVAVRVAPAWENHISPWAAVVAALAAIAVGLVFGLRPARKAGRLDVVDCLRGERA
ncbi:MAG: ABC transporter permease [Deltaproteobacteria bacterium]|nr:ABC transporter permease [Deltaproteobacteria bacterium]